MALRLKVNLVGLATSNNLPNGVVGTFQDPDADTSGQFQVNFLNAAVANAYLTIGQQYFIDITNTADQATVAAAITATPIDNQN